MAVSQIGVGKLGVGLETVDPNTNLPLTNIQLQERFSLIQKANINEIDIWSAPIPTNWFPFLENFVKGN